MTPNSPVKNNASLVDGMDGGSMMQLTDCTADLMMPPLLIDNVARLAKRLGGYDAPIPPPPISSSLKSLSPPSSPSLGIIKGAGNGKYLDQTTLRLELRDYYGEF